MFAYVISEGRLLGLGAIEWSMLLAGSALGGFFTLVF
jgi:hypothetical protein